MTQPAQSSLRNFGRRVGPPRFAMFMAILLAGSVGYHHWLQPRSWHESLTMGFDLAAAVFLFSLIPFLREEGVDTIRRHAAENDANRVLILLLTALITGVVTAAIAGELPAARHGELLAILKLVGTLLLTWLFVNCTYALHYAHEFYRAAPGLGGDPQGLDFPETPEPSYSDFVYFACTLGMTFQTSDVSITAPKMRGIVLLHSFVAFLFNMGVIAFTINALGGIGSSAN